jgi:hypothetical protein
MATTPARRFAAPSSQVHCPVQCVECAIEYDNEPDVEEAYCPWCGALSPECVEWLTWAELQAAEEAAEAG